MADCVREWEIAPCSMAMAFVIGLPFWCKHCHVMWQPELMKSNG